ncbi:MAG: BamA/TamA family outer membrane protein, partial [Odoribacter sp.]|nr:BamA/TamA family outer membrane protein [Odoribacter sp.]
GNNKEQHTTYKRQEKQIRLDFSRRILPDTYIGGISLFCHVNGKHFKDITFLKGEKNNITVQGFGLFVSYDSRDFQPNPLEGTYIKLEQLFFPDFWDNPFKRTEFNFRQYNKIWQGAILASDLQGTFNYGNPPWSMVALIGGSNRMRGYYEGQYRDSKSIQAQIEIRQHIYNRHGMVLWGGAGNVFPDFRHFRWKEMLPTYGIGYRWEFKKRVNIRLDYGFGKGQNAFYFNIDEAF